MTALSRLIALAIHLLLPKTFSSFSRFKSHLSATTALAGASIIALRWVVDTSLNPRSIRHIESASSAPVDEWLR